MHGHLLLGLQIADQAMRVEIAEKQHELEKQQGCAPYRGRSPEPREDEFRDHRLDLEQEESAQEDGGRVNKHGPSSIP